MNNYKRKYQEQDIFDDIFSFEDEGFFTNDISQVNSPPQKKIKYFTFVDVKDAIEQEDEPVYVPSYSIVLENPQPIEALSLYNSVDPISIMKGNVNNVNGMEFQENKKTMKSSLSKIPDFCWLGIYSFIGIEQLFINQPFILNTNTKETLYNNDLFWEGVASILTTRDVVVSEFTNIRSYCFFKYANFKRQESLKIHMMRGRISNLPLIQAHPVVNNITYPCHVISHNPTCFHFKTQNDELRSSMKWTVHVFLRNVARIVCLKIRTEFVDKITHTMVLKANVGGEWIQIFNYETVVQLGIIELFERLKLDTNTEFSRAENQTLDKRFAKLRFGDLMHDRYFIWFCNSILKWIPFPIEDVYSQKNFEGHLDFGIDVERNRKLVKYYKYKTALNL